MRTRIVGFRAACTGGLGFLSALMFAQNASRAPGTAALVPHPATLRMNDGRFLLTAQTRILAAKEAARAGSLLAGWLAADTGIAPALSDSAQGDDSIVLRIAPEGAQNREGYSLRITPRQVRIEAASHDGIIYGCQTLRQLLTHGAKEGWMAPLVEIEDKPRFAWRGLMLDCSRTFLSTSYLKRYIDLLSYHKLNILHLHLTDDEGWRVEVKGYPQLTAIGSRSAWGGGPGGYYSQDEIRDLVRYAADRGVTLVPEIDVPSHSKAALNAYPELACTGPTPKDVFCAGNDHTFELIEGVLAEVCDLFPSAYIHVGGDERRKGRWEACARCQARIRAEGLKSEAELQSYFMRRIARFLEARGRKAVGWDEMIEGGLPPNATVMFWRGLKEVASVTAAGHDVVLSPWDYCYLDHKQSDLPQEAGQGKIPMLIDEVYGFDPLPADFGQGGEHVLGAQANMWTHIARTEDEIDKQIFPRLAALAEVTWTAQALRDWDGFRERLRVHCRRLDRMGVKFGINFRPDPSVWADPARKAAP